MDTSSACWLRWPNCETQGFATSGDYLRKDFRLQLGELLDQGIPVTLAHGDRDFTANCKSPIPPLLFGEFSGWGVLTRLGFGGEVLSLQIPFDDSDDFGDAGYADFVVDGSVAGKTRQAGLLSFTRVFQAGHESTSLSLPFLSLSLPPHPFVHQVIVD